MILFLIVLWSSPVDISILDPILFHELHNILIIQCKIDILEVVSFVIMFP